MNFMIESPGNLALCIYQLEYVGDMTLWWHGRVSLMTLLLMKEAFIAAFLISDPYKVCPTLRVAGGGCYAKVLQLTHNFAMHLLKKEKRPKLWGTEGGIPYVPLQNNVGSVQKVMFLYWLTRRLYCSQSSKIAWVMGANAIISGLKAIVQLLQLERNEGTLKSFVPNWP